jgi:hypothetical protein
MKYKGQVYGKGTTRKPLAKEGRKTKQIET